jgi:hypothetical protein
MTKAVKPTTASARRFAAADTPPPADVQLTWAEVRALGLTEAPADIGSSDYQAYRARRKENPR